MFLFRFLRFNIGRRQNNLPESVNWFEEGYVTSVKKQGACGACHVFSAVGAVEAQHFKATGWLLNMSPQNLLDCTYENPYNNLRCNGGYLETCFEYIVNV
jgi:C1A family cysteine protease